MFQTPLPPTSIHFLRRLSFGIVLAWLSLFLAGVFLPWLELVSGGLGPAAVLAYLAGQPFCHQIPERSFCLAGVPLALCARCTGLLFGFWLGWLGAGIKRGAATATALGRSGLVLALLPLAGDGLLNFLGLLNSPNGLRAATGVIAGAGLGAGLLPAWNQMIELVGSGFGLRKASAEQGTLR